MKHCAGCGRTATPYNSTECDRCRKPVCTDCEQQCMASDFTGCPACHRAACPTTECIEAT